MKTREWRANVALAIVSVTIAIIVGELISRAFFPSWAPRTGRLTKFWEYDSTLGWAHKPNQEGNFRSFGFDTFVRINSHGFRGPERSFAKASEPQRVIVLGDSFVWGFGVEEDQTFPWVLEREIGGGVEVINLGVSGYSTDQELLLYRVLGRKYEADVVVLVIAANDVALNAEPVAYLIYPKPVFELDGATLRLTNQPVPVKSWLERSVVKLAAHSYVLNQLNRARETWRLRNAPTTATRAPDRTRSSFPRTPAEKITLRLIEVFRSEVERDGAEFLVVLVDNMYGGQQFSDALVERRIRFVALDEVMSRQNENVHLPDDLHWNALGHELAAGAIENEVAAALSRSRN